MTRSGPLEQLLLLGKKWPQLVPRFKDWTTYPSYPVGWLRTPIIRHRGTSRASVFAASNSALAPHAPRRPAAECPLNAARGRPRFELRRSWSNVAWTRLGKVTGIHWFSHGNTDVIEFSTIDMGWFLCCIASSQLHNWVVDSGGMAHIPQLYHYSNYWGYPLHRPPGCFGRLFNGFFEASNRLRGSRWDACVRKTLR